MALVFLAREEKAILYSSHVLEAVERLCDREQIEEEMDGCEGDFQLVG